MKNDCFLSFIFFLLSISIRLRRVKLKGVLMFLVKDEINSEKSNARARVLVI